MIIARTTAGLAFALALCTAPLARADEVAQPVSPNASPEARALLQFLYDISGKYTLTGQHNFPAVHDRNSLFAAEYIGKTPVIWGSDWGHAKAGDSDSYLARPEIVQEAIRQHQLGAIVALCWHAIPPTSDEPGTFRPLPGADPNHLKSVQGKLTDEQFQEILTPGTPLYNKWCAQVDVIAGFLKQLQDAHVPVLWRPYHEMNGDWFWWGYRTGAYSTAALYRQLFDRYTNVHHLTNLIWVWSMDRVHNAQMAHANYFPGSQYVDVLGLDVYGNDFGQQYYDSLVALAKGKPLALAEVGSPPTADVLQKQPLWTYYMTWAGMVRNTPRAQYAALVEDSRYLNLDDPTYWKLTSAYRQASGLPPLHYVRKLDDFSGFWVLNEEKSHFGRMGAGSAAARLEISEKGSLLTIRTTRESEYGEPQTSEETLNLDGTPSTTTFMNSPRVTTAAALDDGTKIKIDSTLSPAWAPGTKSVSTETWQLAEGGRELTIERTAPGFGGGAPQTVDLVFEKR